MGQKVQPNGIRLGIVKDWNAKWYANSNSYAATLASDIKIREYLTSKLSNAAVSKIAIDRPAQNLNVTIYTARPGIVIGKKGEDIERLRANLSRLMEVRFRLQWKRSASLSLMQNWLLKIFVSSSKKELCFVVL